MIAESTLEKARFFLREAERAGTTERERFTANLEAAIVYGRSVTFHLQYEYADEPGFQEWYEGQKALMQVDPLLVFLKEARNLALKRGPIEIRRMVLINVGDVVVAAGSLDIQIIRSGPWYRRGPSILWSDLSYAAKRRLARAWRRIRRLAPAKQSVRVVRPRIEQIFHFTDPEWSQRPATDLVNEYLDKLEPVLSEARARFGRRQGGEP